MRQIAFTALEDIKYMYLGFPNTPAEDSVLKKDAFVEGEVMYDDDGFIHVVTDDGFLMYIPKSLITVENSNAVGVVSEYCMGRDTLANWYYIDNYWRHCITQSNGDRYVDSVLQEDNFNTEKA